MRVLIGLTEVSGYYEGLKRGFDELGIHAVHIHLQPHRFGYKAEKGLGLVPWLAQVTVVRRVQAIAAGRYWLAALWLGPVLLTRLALLVWAILRFDAFILGAGASFFRYRELPLLRLLGKRLVYFFHGTDSRPAYMDGFFRDQHRAAFDQVAQPLLDASATARARESRRRFRDVRYIERYVDFVVCAPSHSHFLSRPFICSLYIGIPRVVDAPKEVSVGRAASPVRVLHAPSERAGKGSDWIRAAVASVQAKGLDVDYVEISGKSNVEVLSEIARCDFVVDQAYSDAPMASFATEAALLGKPAVVGGYYADAIRNDLAPDVIPPTLFCLPEDLPGAIERLVRDSAYRQALGGQARAYVLSNWSPRCVAQRMLKLLQREADSAWFYDPQRLTYLHGIGLSASQARSVVRAVLEEEGEAALCLDDKPALKQRFIQFARKAEAAA